MDFIQEMGIKELEHVVLKAYERMELGDRVFEPGEPILYFDNIQIAHLSEDTRVIAARGGYLNQPRVVWEDRQDTTFQFSNGTLNEVSLNLLLEANMIKRIDYHIPFKWRAQIDDYGKIYLPHAIDDSKPRFYYIFSHENMQEKVKPLEENEKTIVFDKKYTGAEILADYYFVPKNAAITYTMDRERKPNLYSLEATFQMKDDDEGLLHTGILEMPKVYILSNINLRMGERADPTVGTFRIIALPDVVDNHEAMVCRISYIDDDVYGI